MVQMEAVSKVYPGEVRAVSEVTLDIDRGETVCLIGPSGSGKSTLLKMINMLVEPTSGSIRVDGFDIKEIEPIDLRRRTGYVMQSGGLFPHLTVMGNLSLMPELEGWSVEKTKKRAYWLLEHVSLDPEKYKDRYPSELSGGQAQRVGIARALMLDPDLILMDEPFGSLDPLTRRALQDEFLELKHSMNKTICVVTHDMEEAFRLGDRIALLKEGELLQFGTEEQLKSGSASEFVTEFLAAQADPEEAAAP